MESNDSMKQIIKDGAIFGLLSVIIGLLSYIVDVTAFASLKYLAFILVFSFAVVFVFSVRNRKALGGYISFKNAFIYSFGILAVAGLIGTLFNLLLFVVIDPGAVDVIVQASLDNTEALMERFDTPDDAIDEALDQAEQDTYDRFTALGMIKGYFIAWVFYGIVALIVGAIVKRKEQERDI